MPRCRNFFISVSVLLLTLCVALYQWQRLRQEFLFTQQLSAPSQSHGRFTQGSIFQGSELDQRHGTNEQSAMDSLKQQVQGLVQEASTYRQDMEEVKERVLKLEREIREINKSHTDGTMREMMQWSSPEEERELSAVEFSPLKDKMASRDTHMRHYFMSALKGRGWTEGPPELFFFPEGANDTRLLCLRGNSTSDGSNNGYAFVEGVPTAVTVLPGVTLLSDTFWDFTNPWHSMYNLLEFVYWRVDSGCPHADNLLLFHQGEFRTTMGSWIKSILQACGFPTEVLSPERGGYHSAVCFEQAIVSRSGIGGMKRPLLSRMFKEVRCQVRRACNIQSVRKSGGVYDGRRVNVTLIVRQGARGFVDAGAWMRVVEEQCEAALDCRWNVMHVANLTFCQQVEAMTFTDILLSAHGAQLTNMIFMDPGGRVMEVFPFGWLEMAGHGQYIYKRLAGWLDLEHEGYWRDTSTTPCLDVTNVKKCFSHYKDQPIGINVTYIGSWLNNVIENFKYSSLYSLNSSQKDDKENPSYVTTCECDVK